MGKLAFVFPGQGSQYVGMGREMAEHFPEAKAVFEAAAAIISPDFVDIIYSGPEEALRQTAITQPAILTASVACLRVLESRGIKPDCVAGHSLGEYSAHVAAGTLSFRDAVQLVAERGRLMQEAVPSGGAMTAVLGLSRDKVEQVCRKASCQGVVEVANYNCPGQLVISGQAGAVETAAGLCKQAGAKRALPLQVSGPFHSSLMIPAGEQLAERLAGVEINSPDIPVIANINGNYVKTRKDIASSLIGQVSSSVRWEECIQRLVADGADLFVEVGPGKVLTGLIKKIAPGVGLANVEDLITFEKFLAYLKESR